MTQEQPATLTDRVYHGWLDDRIVSVDRVCVRNGVAEIKDLLPYAPAKVGETFFGFEWGPNVYDDTRGGRGTSILRAGNRNALAYALLLDCFGVRELALRYQHYFDNQVLQSIGGDVPFQMLGSQVRAWVRIQIRADGTLGHSVASANVNRSVVYVCPVCGSLEFETEYRKAGEWCHFYPLTNMIAIAPLALGDNVDDLPARLKVPYSAVDGFEWSDAAHQAAGVGRCNEFVPAARVLKRTNGGAT